MKVDPIELIKNEIDYKYGRVRHIWSEFPSAYPNERIELTRELDTLKAEIKSDIRQVECLLKELQGDYSRTF